MKSTPQQLGHLLIVDDEADILDILADLLGPHVGHISRAKDGLEALAAIKTGAIDAVISDINMPKMNGLHLLAHVRALGLETPFAVLTAYGDRKNLQEAIRLDATAFLDKPFDNVEVIRTAVDCLKMGMAIKEMESALHALFERSDLPADEIVRIKHVRRVLASMRIRSATLKAG